MTKPEAAETPPSTPTREGIDAGEIDKFSQLAERWWDPEGPMRPLHAMNPTRLAFIREEAIRHFSLEDGRKGAPLEGLSLLDIGCGGGLSSEPLARMGAKVTGIDASAEMIAAARTHAEGEGLAIDYRCATAEALAAEGSIFDLVVALEIVEHVAEPAAFLAAAARLLRPGGLLVVSTLNRTRKSYLMAILGAEYLLRWLPRGTHDWTRFLRPAEIAAGLRPEGVQIRRLAGMTYNPLSGGWRLDRDSDVNYILAAEKPAS